jgi:nitrogenase molybdenum-iron protein alpha/beta subunit
MTGACACLAGFENVTVVIHGSSGCYYYPATLLHAPLHGTFILEHEVIFGSEQRLHEVLDGLSRCGNRIAVVMTCVPAIVGEDIRSILKDYDVILVDSPGFSGDVETGYKKALSVMGPSVDPDIPGINIDGACLFDPFSSGNVREIIRMLNDASVPVGTVFCSGRLEETGHVASYTIGTNEDFFSGIGERLGGTLGFKEIASTFNRIASLFPDADISAVIEEMEREDERIIRACDKFLRRFNPPHTMIFGGFSYAMFAADTLKHYLDADIQYLGSRNEPGATSYPVEHVQGFTRVKELIRCYNPDLIIGSSFERSVDPKRAFVGIIPPIRDMIRLAHHPVAGISGSLTFIENVLNSCMDRNR